MTKEGLVKGLFGCVVFVVIVIAIVLAAEPFE